MKLSSFANEKARQRYHAVYDELLDWPLPCEDVTVETSFGPTYVRRSGNGTGEPIVLLHGLGSTSLVWQRSIADLGQDHLLYAVDSMGEAGRSVQTRPIPDAQANADWLAEVLEGLGHEKYHLVGLSRGGWLALNQAMRSPARVGRVTSLDGHAFLQNENAGRIYLFVGLLVMLMPDFLRRRIKPDSRLAVFADPLLRKLVLAGLGFQMRFAIFGYFDDENVRAIDVPTRLVLCARDSRRTVQEVTGRLARLAPHVEVVPVDLHHGLLLIEPEFLREQVTASQSPPA